MELRDNRAGHTRRGTKGAIIHPTERWEPAGYMARAGFTLASGESVGPREAETENPCPNCEGKSIIKDPNSRLKVYTRYIFCPSCRGSGRRNGNGGT